MRALLCFHPSQGKYCGPRLAASAHQNLYLVLMAIVQGGISLPGKTLPSSITCLMPR